jgi:hypothetical protein
MKLIYDTSECSFDQEINESGSKKYVIKGVFSSPGVKNKNGRIYPKSIWEAEVAKYQDVMKSGSSNSLLELNHPARSNVEMMEAVAKMRRLYMENGKVYGEAVLLDNPKANQLKTLIDNGIKMSVSSRGLGSVSENVVTDYKLITFDIIPDQGQSDHAAEMMGITEGILETKNFEVDAKGNINEVQICTDTACHMFEAEDIRKATAQKFGEILAAMKGSLTESPVGIVGRTGEVDADAHITPELIKRFKKIVKELGGKTVATKLLNSMGIMPVKV